MTDKKVVLVVDDESTSTSIVTSFLTPMFNVWACRSGEEALRILTMNDKPDIILLDIVMDGICGYETLEQIRKNPITKDIPVIFISRLNSDNDEDKGFRLGAVDYITKPFKKTIVLARVNTHLELKQGRDLLKYKNQWLEAEIRGRIAENQIIQEAALTALTQLAESRDFDTGSHILRTCNYIKVLAENITRTPQFAEELSQDSILRIIKAAPLHDIGKVGIPDAILLKNGKLDPEEIEIVKTHCQIGADTLRSAINKVQEIRKAQPESEKEDSLLLLEEAENIARYHHEKWDGSGYPFGLKGQEIPLSARLMALADVFDALTTERPYKKAWKFKDAADLVISQKSKHFDPAVVNVFQHELDTFENILSTTVENQ